MELAVLGFAHWFGDYPAQADWMALNKRSRIDALLLHCAVYTIFASAGLWLLGAANVWTIAAVFVSHVIVDSREWSVPWSTYPPLSKQIDQAAHGLVLLACFVVMVGW